MLLLMMARLYYTRWQIAMDEAIIIIIASEFCGDFLISAASRVIVPFSYIFVPGLTHMAKKCT
jgi:hypothetical protein